MTYRTWTVFNLLLLSLIAATAAFGQEPQRDVNLGVGQKRLAQIVEPHYWERQYQLKQRWRNAIEIRREYNAAKGPARGWLAIRIPWNPLALPDPVGHQQELLRRHRERMWSRPRYSWRDFYIDLNDWLAEAENY